MALSATVCTVCRNDTRCLFKLIIKFALLALIWNSFFFVLQEMGARDVRFQLVEVFSYSLDRGGAINSKFAIAKERT